MGSDRTAKEEKLLLTALRGDVTPRPPVWLMRQAGRYLPEYRAVRGSVGGFLDLCYTPELAEEVTLQPIRRFGFDAAILFSDILVVPHALGVGLRFVEGLGPQLDPVRCHADVDRLERGDIGSLQPVYETLRRLQHSLPAETALIGFAGAPWTLAAYMVEGGGSRDFAVARTFARQERELFARLIDRLVTAVTAFLDGQIGAGAEAVQLFDSWAGVLPPGELRAWCIEPTRRIVEELRRRRPQVPIVCFPRGVGVGYIDFAALVRPDALGLDTTVPMGWAAGALPRRICLQGNLDPVALLAGDEAMLMEAEAIRSAARGRAHVFNLGHGVLPQTGPDAVARLTEWLKSPDYLQSSAE
jgi:uroporphyrinogen decarboxylase